MHGKDSRHAGVVAQRHVASEIKLRWTIHQSSNWDASGALELRARGVTLTYARYAHADAVGVASGGSSSAAASATRPLACEWQFRVQVGKLEVLDGLSEDASGGRQPGAPTRGCYLLSQARALAAPTTNGAHWCTCPRSGE